MAKFSDKSGQVWRLAIDCDVTRRVRKLLGVDIGALHKNDCAGLKELFEDEELLVNLTFALIEDQARAAGVGPEEFARRLNGDILEAMGMAFLDALADFFPNRRRQALQAALAKSQEMNARLDAELEKALQTMAARPVEEMLQQLQNLSPTSTG